MPLRMGAAVESNRFRETLMELELISFKLCPFVQRSIIMLKCKQLPFNISYIDLADPPAWFREISPFGKVPILRVEDQHSIFESAVINEFLNEITPGNLLPDEPLQRAINRGWIEFASACVLDLAAIMRAENAEKFDAAHAALTKKMTRLESALGAGPYFTGGELSLVDFAYAPLFMRAELLGLGEDVYPAANCPGIAPWSQALLGLAAVKDSVVPEFPELLRGRIREMAPYTAARLDLA